MQNTIKSRKNFDFEDASVIVLPAIIVKFRPRKTESGQYGLVASKRTFPTAVRRNRARRLIRAWMAKCDRPPKFDVLFIARGKILETTLTQGVGQMAKAFGKIRKSRKKSAKSKSPGTPPREQF